MKKILLGIVALIALGGAANASDSTKQRIALNNEILNDLYDKTIKIVNKNVGSYDNLSTATQAEIATLDKLLKANCGASLNLKIIDKKGVEKTIDLTAIRNSYNKVVKTYIKNGDKIGLLNFLGFMTRANKDIIKAYGLPQKDQVMMSYLAFLNSINGYYGNGLSATRLIVNDVCLNNEGTDIVLGMQNEEYRNVMYMLANSQTDKVVEMFEDKNLNNTSEDYKEYPFLNYLLAGEVCNISGGLSAFNAKYPEYGEIAKFRVMDQSCQNLYNPAIYKTNK